MDVGFRDSASTFIRMTQSYIKSFDYGTGPKNMGAMFQRHFQDMTTPDIDWFAKAWMRLMRRKVKNCQHLVPLVKMYCRLARLGYIMNCPSCVFISELSVAYYIHFCFWRKTMLWDMGWACSISLSWVATNLLFLLAAFSGLCSWWWIAFRRGKNNRKNTIYAISNKRKEGNPMGNGHEYKWTWGRRWFSHTGIHDKSCTTNNHSGYRQ